MPIKTLMDFCMYHIAKKARLEHDMWWNHHRK